MRARSGFFCSCLVRLQPPDCMQRSSRARQKEVEKSDVVKVKEASSRHKKKCNGKIKGNKQVFKCSFMLIFGSTRRDRLCRKITEEKKK